MLSDRVRNGRLTAWGWVVLATNTTKELLVAAYLFMGNVLGWAAEEILVATRPKW